MVRGIGDSACAIKLDAPHGMAGAAGLLVLKGGTYFTVQAAHRTKTSDALIQSVTDLAKKAASKLQ